MNNLLLKDAIVACAVFALFVPIIAFVLALIFSNKSSSAPITNAQSGGGGRRKKQTLELASSPPSECASSEKLIDNSKAHGALSQDSDEIEKSTDNIGTRIVNLIANESIGAASVSEHQILHALGDDGLRDDVHQFFEYLQRRGYVINTSPRRWKFTDLGYQQMGAL